MYLNKSTKKGLFTIIFRLVSQGVLNQTRDSEINESDGSSMITAGNAARRVVSGFYSLSKASWNTLTPLLQKVCQNPPLNTTKVKSDKSDKMATLFKTVVNVQIWFKIQGGIVK